VQAAETSWIAWVRLREILGAAFSETGVVGEDVGDSKSAGA
jgi:hypothetical protein